MTDLRHIKDDFCGGLTPLFCFAAVLSDVKRIKLIMQVLKLNNKNKEAVAKAQFDTWWHFIKLLGPKASVYFEQVNSITTGMSTP